MGKWWQNFRVCHRRHLHIFWNRDIKKSQHTADPHSNKSLTLLYHEEEFVCK
nr:MAG TPA: hypothetical protein [Caudoviricetes sp.]